MRGFTLLTATILTFGYETAVIRPVAPPADITPGGRSHIEAKPARLGTRTSL
jgi:hypothetical protein